ncbi:hypothetical protein ACNPNN_11710 [Stenotrophomonas geniculata]|uniref:hypothetical protein n=1 Tax=Stenotrophomonas geniculata TaxID=86188 RepID=UPI003AAF99D5
MNMGSYKSPAKQPAPVDPLSLAAELHRRSFENLAQATSLDEEALTACFLGGLTTSFSIVAALCHIDPNATPPLSWTQYRKKAGNEKLLNESDVGADFAMVCWRPDRKMRIALFQAKNGQCKTDVEDESREEWKLNVHRRPKKPEPDTPWREAQMVRLVRTSILFEEVRTSSLSTGLPKSIQEAQTKADNANDEELTSHCKNVKWIKYIGYFNGKAVCIPISNISDALPKELEEKSFTHNWITLTDKSSPTDFADTLTHGLGTDDSWLELNEETGIALLPSLIDLMPIYVGRSGGGKKLEIKNAVALSLTINQKFQNSLKNEFDRLREISPQPTPTHG